MRWITAGIPIAGRSSFVPLRQMANLATKAGVEGRQKLVIHAPLMQLTKAQIIKRGMELGVDYGLTSSCYDPAPDGKPCGQCDSCFLRRKGFSENGIDDPLPYPGYAGDRDELCGQRDFLYAARRRRAGGTRGGVLPVCGMQFVVGARERSGVGDLPVLRYAICWRGRARAEADLKLRKIWPRRLRRSGLGAEPEGTRFVVCTGGEPLLQLDRS